MSTDKLNDETLNDWSAFKGEVRTTDSGLVVGARS